MKHDGSEELSGEHPVGFMAHFSSEKPRGRVWTSRIHASRRAQQYRITDHADPLGMGIKMTLQQNKNHHPPQHPSSISHS